MNIISVPSSSTSKLAHFSPAQNPDYPNFHFQTFRSLYSSLHSREVSPIRSHDQASSPILHEKPQISSIKDEQGELEDVENSLDEEITKAKKSLEELLVIRKPATEISDEEGEESSYGSVKDGDSKEVAASSVIDEGLSRFAKKMPFFEPERVESSAKERPLLVNLDLALYKAKIYTRNYQYKEAEDLLRECIKFWPEDGRPYVALGKTLSKQSKWEEARSVYEKGCQSTQGENSYIWQCWAVLENKLGNVRRSRELFDAATVADNKHIAAWHGWAVLEMKQGNIQKARYLLGKGLKYCGGNEYVYQTLALLEVKARRYEQARQLFSQATKCNPRSCASWLAWAQLEVQLENHPAARSFFERAVQASPKNRFAWHVWGVFEANLGNVDLARKLLKIGHIVNPRDPVLLQSLALLEYRNSTVTLARELFRRAAQLDPSHQPVWIAWGWMEWKEGNLDKARELYRKALSINTTTESAARCLQAWGVLEQREGNLSAARRLFRSSLNVNSQSYITWMTWASLEEDQGNSVRAEEIRNLFFQQRTEIVDDASWVMGFMDIIDPAIDSIKRLLNMEASEVSSVRGENEDSGSTNDDDAVEDKSDGFELDSFVREKLFLDPSNLEVRMASQPETSGRRSSDSDRRNASAIPKM